MTSPNLCAVSVRHAISGELLGTFQVDCQGAVAQLRIAVRSALGSGAVKLISGLHILSDDEAFLSDFGISDGSEIDAILFPFPEGYFESEEYPSRMVQQDSFVASMINMISVEAANSGYSFVVSLRFDGRGNCALIIDEAFGGGVTFDFEQYDCAVFCGDDGVWCLRSVQYRCSDYQACAEVHKSKCFLFTVDLDWTQMYLDLSSLSRFGISLTQTWVPLKRGVNSDHAD